jgi:hypothetical protein
MHGRVDKDIYTWEIGSGNAMKTTGTSTNLWTTPVIAMNTGVDRDLFAGGQIPDNWLEGTGTLTAYVYCIHNCATPSVLNYDLLMNRGINTLDNYGTPFGTQVNAATVTVNSSSGAWRTQVISHVFSGSADLSPYDQLSVQFGRNGLQASDTLPTFWYISSIELVFDPSFN